MTARGEILSRIRTALAPSKGRVEPPIPRDYLRNSPLHGDELVKLFAERVGDYRAEVHIISADALQDAVAAICDKAHGQSIVTPDDLPHAWIPDHIGAARESKLDNDAISKINIALTACACAIAQTGTLVLDGGMFQGRRKATLLPDHHICVVWRDQIVGIVPEAVSRLGVAATQDKRPITFISGPSATSDIELNRVEGVHGPRNLYVLIVNADRPSNTA